MSRSMTLELAITINPEAGTFDVDAHDPESGCDAHFLDIPIEGNRDKFNENIGNEIYSWASLMMDEAEEEEEDDEDE